jgi:hypothetical protein
MYCYNAYGLGIRSALPLPELVATAEIGTDVVIQLGKVDRLLPKTSLMEDNFHLTAQSACFFWERTGTFLVKDGKEIIVEPFPGVDERLIRLPLLGTVLAVLLYQRGFLVLHASAIAINSGVVAFLGGKGQGKSTMAATLYRRGHQLMADDVVALDFSNPRNPLVLSGFPQFKLWPEAAASTLGDDPEILPQLASGYEKRARRAVDRFSYTPLPIRYLCVLCEGPAPALTPLQPQEAIVQMIANSYVARFGNQLLQGIGAVAHLRQCASLIKSVPVYYLERPRSLSLLPAIAWMVEDHFTHNNHLAKV